MVDRIPTSAFGLRDHAGEQRSLRSFDLELTARCNLDCRHCYINLPAGDAGARAAEMTAPEILALAEDAAELGALWCLITGGEPLLRPDFPEIYQGLKRLGLLVSVFTNACLVSPAHVELFRSYPPRDVEVSVYGATQQTYETVTRRAGSYAAFRRGLDLMRAGGVRVRLKAAAMRSTYRELDAIAEFSRQYTDEYYRFDPLLRLRFDGDARRNAEIIAERLTPDDIVAAERADDERFRVLQSGHDDGTLVDRQGSRTASDRLFGCEAGLSSFVVGCDGTFRLCAALWHPDTTYDLRSGSLRDAWERWVPEVRASRSDDAEYLAKCAACPIVNLCLACPAHAYLEAGAMDAVVPYFCEVAHARAASLKGRGDDVDSVMSASSDSE